MSQPDLNYPYFTFLGRWQSQRPLWLAGAGAALSLEIFSVLYFQKYLGLQPCLYCVYIREATLLIALGGFWAAIWPQNLFFRLTGYLGSLAGVGLGLYFSVKLEFLDLAAAHWPEGYVSCGARPGWALGRWLARSWPTHFAPRGQCGVDSQWSFLSLSMAEMLIVVYVLALIGLSLGLGAGLAERARLASSSQGLRDRHF
ncbi:MAG: disulfide bond formation protein B [Deltaproteobacteria bacterium]|jgi:disulfide bond formation protein DsbB|nr:disulfide bond formation protein B [Deltaproteobacteria bacterium]